MGEVKTYFFDTYAFFEILEANPAYQKYLKNISIITTKLNLMELRYGLLRMYGKKYADESYEELKEFCIDVEDEIIKNASQFKFDNKKKKLSYVDCVGYILAKKFGVKFLTGDKEFENLENVEFVK